MGLINATVIFPKVCRTMYCMCCTSNLASDMVAK